MRTPRLRRKALTKRISKKVEFLSRQLTPPRLCFVHRQLQPCHDVTHPGQRFFRVTEAADHHIVGVVNDVRFKTLLVPEFLPSQHETTHVQIAEHRADRGSLGKFPFRRPGCTYSDVSSRARPFPQPELPATS